MICGTGGLLDREVAVDTHRLGAGEETFFPVQVPPASLDQAGSFGGEMREEASDKIRFGDEIGIEDRDELAVGSGHGIGEGSGLVAGADFPADDVDPDTFCLELCGDAVDQLAGFIGGVVEHLDLVEVRRVIECGDGADGALGNVELVVNWELGGDFGEAVCFAGWVGFVPVLFGEELAGAGLLRFFPKKG